MKSAWSLEFSRILLLLISTILFGLVTDAWLFSVILHSSLYIGWNLFQLRTFELWIRKGAPKKNAPDATGVWQLIVQHIYRSQKSNKDRKQHLAKVANHYHAVMSALPDATIVLSSKHEIEWANKTSQEMLGIDVNKDIGQRIDNIIRDIELQKLFESNDDQATIEIISPVDALINLSITRKKYGSEKSLLVVRNISPRIALQKLRKAFIANASHELRTPLTVISGYLEILDADDELPLAIKGAIKNSLQQALRMDKILTDLLVLSKLEEKRHSQDSGDSVDVSELLSRLVADFKVSHSLFAHEFELRLDRTLKLKVVEQEFYSLCQNLISNAMKYSPDGSMIIISWQLNTNNYACLAISDNGEGIADEHLARLTERFYRINVERNRTVKGTGLGLSIVKHILDNFGGYLEIKSNEGKGSTFTACFPLYRVIREE